MIDRLNLLVATAAGGLGAVRDRLGREEGQTFVEYALVLALITAVVAILIAWTNIATSITNTLNDVADAF
jgi:Flp pilus assembly pilin Flp